MPTKKKIESGKLAGTGNVLPHQYIISDLIFYARKKLKNTKYKVLSEISISQIGTVYTDKKFTVNHNIDFVIFDAKTQKIVFIAEVERTGRGKNQTLKKLKECLTNIPTIEEAYTISFDVNLKIIISRYEIVKGKLEVVSTSSDSAFLGYNLKRSFVSLK